MGQVRITKSFKQFTGNPIGNKLTQTLRQEDAKQPQTETKRGSDKTCVKRQRAEAITRDMTRRVSQKQAGSQQDISPR